MSGISGRLLWPLTGAFSSRAARKLLFRGQAPAAPAADPASPFVSVLDCGAACIKALVVEIDGEGARLLGGGSHSAPTQGASIPADFSESGQTGGAIGGSPALVHAAEQALVAAEDAAQQLPRRALIGIAAGRCAVVTGSAAADRPHAANPITSREVDLLVEAALRNAVLAAEQAFAAECARTVAFEVVQYELRAPLIDEQPVTSAEGMRGRRLSVSLTAACAQSDEIQRLRGLVDALDLDLAACLAGPFALAHALLPRLEESALVVEVGADATSVTLLGPGGLEGHRAFALGGRALERRVVEHLGVDAASARDVVIAHAAGGAAYAAGGSAGARLVRQLAAHHAEVWLDAFELTCVELSLGRELPPHIFLCGGGAQLPELQRALGGASWHVALPFAAPPTIQLLSPAHLCDAEEPLLRLPSLQATPAICLALSARTAAGVLAGVAG